MKYNESIDKKLEVIKLLVSKEINTREASEMLSLSIRQVLRMKAEHLSTGKLAKHKNTGNKHAKRINDDITKRILEVRNMQTDRGIRLYDDTNFLYFRECLEEVGIDIKYHTLYRLLVSNNIKSPRKHKPIKQDKQHKTRNRRATFGELLQIDASKHQWFYKLGDNKYYNIHGFIDDATL
jgi:transposase